MPVSLITKRCKERLNASPRQQLQENHRHYRQGNRALSHNQGEEVVEERGISDLHSNFCIFS